VCLASRIVDLLPRFAPRPEIIMRPHPGSTALRRFALVIALLATLVVLPAHAAWQPGGVRLYEVPPEWFYDSRGIVSDGMGGAIVSSVVFRSYPYPSDYHLSAQKVDSDGNVPAPWPAGGRVVRSWSLEPYSNSPVITPLPMLTDGAGGAISPETSAENIVTFRTRFHLYQITSDGTLIGVPGYSGSFTGPDVVGAVVDIDGAGGVVMMATPPYPTVPRNLYAQRVDPQGTTLWGLGSVICNAEIQAGGWDVLGDGAGGGFFAWCQHGAAGVLDLYVQHLDATGAIAPGWPAAGRLVRSAPGNVETVELAPNGQGGAMLVWRDERNVQPHLYAHVVLADGSLAPGIPADGRALASNNLNDNFGGLVSDEQGGAFLVRFSHDYYDNQQLRLYRLDPSMLPRPGWPAEGKDLDDFHTVGCDVVADGVGGAFVAYTSDDGANLRGIIGQHLAADGSPAPGWTNNGYVLSPTGGWGMIVRSGAGAIVSWVDNRPDGRGIYAQRLVPDGPVAVQLSLVGATAEPGNVSLHWYATGAAMLAAAVERRTENGEWTELGAVSADGAGHLRYEDGSVTGGRFGYRVTWTEDGTVRHAGEVWVDVPDAWRLALSAPRPNPGSGPASFAITLADRAPASIELLDLQGRRVAHRDLSTLDPGSHVVRFEEAAALAPGVYLARLTQGVDTRTVRMIRIR
jgi:hypothetical protein